MLTILLPFFNEEGWIGQTIDSLARQRDDRFELIMIDNGSTDAGAAEARRHARMLGVHVTELECPTPGKVHALAAGLHRVRTPLVAICDADTLYPPEYVGRIVDLFGQNPDAAAVMALDLHGPAESSESRRRIAHLMRKTRRFAEKCHAGGYAQAFRTAMLRTAGGFDAARWPYVLEDHEIVHRIMAHGRVIYDPGHVCFPSDRRACRKSVSWTPAERLMYRHMRRSMMDWFFYRFLGPRLAARNGTSMALRTKSWSSAAS